MRVAIVNRRIDIDLQPIILSILILAWAIYYYFSTVNTPDGGVESVLFIKPLTILLTICFPFVVRSSIKIVPEARQSKAEAEIDEDRGFLDQRRFFFAAALGAYAVALTFFGYLIPSILFILVVCYYLGVRNIWILVILPVGLSGFLSIVFKLFIKVPIPIWPW